MKYQKPLVSNYSDYWKNTHLAVIHQPHAGVFLISCANLCELKREPLLADGTKDNRLKIWENRLKIWENRLKIWENRLRKFI